MEAYAEIVKLINNRVLLKQLTPKEALELLANFYERNVKDEKSINY